MRRFRALAAILLLVFAGQAAVSYKVRRGDTLSSIARRHGTSVKAVAEANKLDNPNVIIEGQTLVLPAEGSGTPAGKPQLISNDTVVVGGDGQRRHTVRAGENLARIAARYSTTATELAKANNLANPNRIRAGQTLVVPGEAEPWLCPVDGRVWFSDSFGAPRPGGRRHMGTDLFAFRGTPVRAPVSGRLAHANGSVAGNAFYLYGDDGNRYYGAHLHTLDAGPGRIDRGARIGTVGSTGNAEGLTPHLHLEIHVGGKQPVNPTPTAERWCR